VTDLLRLRRLPCGKAEPFPHGKRQSRGRTKRRPTKRERSAGSKQIYLATVS